MIKLGYVKINAHKNYTLQYKKNQSIDFKGLLRSLINLKSR